MVDKNGKKYLGVEDVAKRFGVNVSTIYRLAHEGGLPGFKIGKQWRFRIDILDEWEKDKAHVDQMRAEDSKNGNQS